jgi:hypothetical protein
MVEVAQRDVSAYSENHQTEAADKENVQGWNAIVGAGARCSFRARSIR